MDKMDYAIEAARKTLETELSAASKAMKTFPRQENGLTPDSVKATAEWKAAKAKLNTAFAVFRKFSQTYKPVRA